MKVICTWCDTIIKEVDNGEDRLVPFGLCEVCKEMSHNKTVDDLTMMLDAQWVKRHKSIKKEVP